MKTKRAVVAALSAITILCLGVGTFGQRARPDEASVKVAKTQPLFSEYKGIRLGMKAQEVRARLGAPTLKGDDQDYYAFSETESAQFAYDKTLAVFTISIDYTGAGAPDYHNVIGPTIDQKEDGSLYKRVNYEDQRFWVSYSRTVGTPPIVTITIQKMQ